MRARALGLACLLSLALAARGGAPAAAAPVSFFTEPVYSSPRAIGELAVGDLNADGWSDLAGCVQDTVVVVWTNREDGTFDPAITVPCAIRSDAAACADFDHDGRDDIAVVGDTSPTGAVSILMSGLGGFSVPELVPTDSNGVVAIVAGDLDADGNPDLVVGNRKRHTVHLLSNLGFAGFAARLLAKLPGGASQLWLADADGDGDDDIFVAQSTYWASYGQIGSPLDSCWVIPNLGAGDFAPPHATGLLGVLLVCDLTGDGIADAVALHAPGSEWYLHRGLGGGAFANGDSIAPGGSLARAPAADLDGDGRMDLLREDSNGSVNSFVPLVQRSPGVFTRTEPYLSSGELLTWAIADFDRDGALDLAHGLTKLHVRRNHHARFDGLVAYDQGASVNAVDVAAGDLDGDGDLDVAVANLYTYSHLYLNAGDGTLGTPRNVLGSYTRQVTFADVTGDSKAELVGQFVDQPASRTYFVPDAGPTWSYPPTGSYSPALYSNAVADWDGNGSNDVLLPDGTCLMNDGAGNFTRLAFTTTGTSQRTIGDFDTDGRVDASSAAADSFYYRPNLLGTQLGAPVPVYAGGAFGGGGYAVGDVDSDGRTDFVARLATGELTCVRSLGGGLFDAPVISALQSAPAGATARQLVVADFDGDGLGDVAVFSTTPPPSPGPPPSCSLRVLRGLGAGVFGEPSDFACGTDFGGATAADLDGNQASDLLWVQGSSSYSRLLSILFSAAAPIVTPVAVSNVGADAFGDRVVLAWWMNGDGAAGATLERSEAGVATAWVALATLRPDGSGIVRYEDRDVTPGGRCGYRLRVRDGAAERTLGEVWVTVPARLAFGIARVWPNPARGGTLRVSLALDRAAPAEVALFDLAGRVVARRALAAGEPGVRDVTLDASRLAPGLYFVRATQDGRVARARLAVSR